MKDMVTGLAARAGLVFLIGNKMAVANCVHVDYVVNALLKCALHPNATGNVFNLSQTIFIEQMSKALFQGLGLKPTLHRCPEFPLRLIAFTLGWIPGFPLTSSRIDAMTSSCRYESTKIVEELEYTFESSLEERFFDFSRSLK